MFCQRGAGSRATLKTKALLCLSADFWANNPPFLQFFLYKNTLIHRTSVMRGGAEVKVSVPT